MARIILYPYKMGSASARALQGAVSSPLHPSKRVRPDGDYAPRADDVIINWGSSGIPEWGMAAPRMLNVPSAVERASNKLIALQTLANNGVTIVPYTTDRVLAEVWIRDGATVICRTLLNSHSGGGIVIARDVDDIVRAPLYTLYKKKRSEYRVHVFKGRIIDVQEKRREAGFERTEDQALVRSHANGWVFCRDNIDEPDFLRIQALGAIQALGLDFGAVDIIYNQRENICYVLEVNTAVGLEGQTLSTYRDAILQHYVDLQ